MQSSRIFSSACRRLPLQLGGAQYRLPDLAFPPQPRAVQLLQRSTFSTRILNNLATTRKPLWRAKSTQRIRKSSSKSANPTLQEEASKSPQSLRARFKELSRKYGWAAVGVYFGLSALDFPFCYLAVRLIGPDRIGEVEHAIIDGFWNLVAIVAPSMAPEKRVLSGEADSDHAPALPSDVESHKVKENASIWTQLLLAYGVHKSLIFFRVPLTAAVTPKIVKTLRSWGYNIGPRVKVPKTPRSPGVKRGGVMDIKSRRF